MESSPLRAASDIVEEADTQASPQQIMESSPLRAASDSDSGATTVPVNKTAVPIQSNANLTCRIYNVGRQEVATGGAAATTVTRRQNSGAYTESKAYDGVLSQEKYPRPNTSKGKSSSQSQRIPIWEIFDEASMCGCKVLARKKISSEGTPPKEMQSDLTCR
jgi:hypothetical protein